MTGLPCAGKTTLASAFCAKRKAEGAYPVLLDGDELRVGLNRDLGFTPEDRSEAARRTAEVAKMLLGLGLQPVVAMVTPYQSDRDRVRALFKPNEFLEVFVCCPITVCMERDPKGHYAEAVKGERTNFTGLGARYETPEHPDVIVHTNLCTVDEGSTQIAQACGNKSSGLST